MSGAAAQIRELEAMWPIPSDSGDQQIHFLHSISTVKLELAK